MMPSFFLMLMGRGKAARNDCKPFCFNNGQAAACVVEFALLPAVAMQVLGMFVDSYSRNLGPEIGNTGGCLAGGCPLKACQICVLWLLAEGEFLAQCPGAYWKNRGSEFGIIRDEPVLAEIEGLYSKRLEVRAELIELLQMWYVLRHRIVRFFNLFLRGYQ